ncbi:MAG: diaminopimelate epimerase [Chitinophagales bacterium]
MQFFKYHGTGNDFILMDNRSGDKSVSRKEIADMCHRRFGIGADGLMLLQNKDGFDFEMIYYNSDGGESSMCGNGGRCIVQFAADLGIIDKAAHFLAIDGAHKAHINAEGVALEMIPVKQYEKQDNAWVLNTGSPHCVVYQKQLKDADIAGQGRKIRNSAPYKKEGINVNFIEAFTKNELYVRTYERGVEDETYSCGTGVVAASLADFLEDKTSDKWRILHTLGGKLKVAFDFEDNAFSNIVLSGPAEYVFKGEWKSK